MSIFHKLSVKEVKRETQNAVSVVLEVPDNLQSEFKFIPGQYITIQIELEGILLRRAYSICSSPNSDELRIAIKEVEKGVFSEYANSKLRQGDILEISAPEGKFILNESEYNHKNYLAFVAGSGITPVLSMIKSFIESKKEGKFILVYGNKSSDTSIFKNEIDHLAEKFRNQFEVNYVFSQKLINNTFFGRINLNVIHEIQKKYRQISFDEYFLCGPETMIDLVKDTLLKDGIEKESIKFELFSSSSNKKEINSDLSGNSKITIILDNEESTIEMRKDEIILDAVLDNGLDAPYSCQGGVCSSCLAKVIEGEAVMDNNTILDDEEVEEGLILTCQAHPVTPTIVIDYDEI